MTPQPNHATSLEFLQWWLPNGPWCLAAIHPDERDRRDYIRSRVFMPGDEEALQAWLTQHNDHNLYYTANQAKPRKDWPARKETSQSERPMREDLARMICLHVDIDPRAG